MVNPQGRAKNGKFQFVQIKVKHIESFSLNKYHKVAPKDKILV